MLRLGQLHYSYARNSVACQDAVFDPGIFLQVEVCAVSPRQLQGLGDPLRMEYLVQDETDSGSSCGCFRMYIAWKDTQC